MQRLVGLALSGLMVAATLCGCTTASSPRLASGSGAPPRAGAVLSTPAPPAISVAEQAVAVAPRDAVARYRLGRAYLSAGRFASAGSAFSDALTLDPTQGQAGVMAALAMLQQGRDEDARSLLATVRGGAPAADLGLALALAGQFEQARSVLEAAVRRSDADAHSRLNLALVYALDGRWNDAAAMASQDVPADRLPDRLHRWARIAQSGLRPADRLTAILGIVPALDPGQPAALALVSPTPAVATAFAGTPQIAVPAPAPIMTPPAAKALTVLSANWSVSLAPKIANDVLKAQYGGRYVVQIGAFTSTRWMEAAWARIGGGRGYLANYVPMESDVRSSPARPTLHRLSVGGFASRRGAMRLCRLIKARGGDCFVRGSSVERPLEWALRGDDHARG